MKLDSTVKEQVKKGRSKFIAMASTYFLGVYNDNYFKQAGLLLAITAGKSYLQGVATILFALPFILFSAYTGWIADKYSKGSVVIFAKFIELVAMIIGAYAIITLNFTLILIIIFSMALQSTLFSPALNGSIPELYPEEFVTEANAILKLVTTIAILLGIALAGVSLDLKIIETEVPFGRWAVVAVMLFIAFLGFIASFGVYKHKPSGEVSKFPVFGPLNSIVDIYRKRTDGPLVLALFGSCYFYFISSLAVLIINEFCVSELKYSKTIASLFIAALMIGICIGSFIAAKVSNSKNWTRLVFPASISLAFGILLVYFSVYIPGVFQKVFLLMALIFTGTVGGILLIPIASFIQVRPAANEKGKVIGAGNFLDFSGIMISGFIYFLMNAVLKLTPSCSLLVTAIIGLVISIVLYFTTRKERYHV